MNTQVATQSNEEIDSIFAPEPPTDPKDRLYPWKELYPSLSRAPHRFSHSSFTLFHSCERKYDLFRNKHIGSSLSDEGLDTSLNNVHLDFGSALGVGIQSLLTHKSLDKAIWDALLTYNYAEESKTKNEISLVNSLKAFQLQGALGADWEVIASELSFKILLDEETQDYYCGYVDAVVRHKESGIYGVVEVKTTGLKLNNLEPLYSNSPQGIGYSVVLDQIAKESASWTILYIVIQFKSNTPIPTIHFYPFEKTKRDKLEWLLTLQLDYKRILEYQSMEFWPKRGDKCLTFMRPCPLYGICDLPTLSTNAPDSEEGKIKKEAKWDYTLHLDDLINQQISA